MPSSWLRVSSRIKSSVPVASPMISDELTPLGLDPAPGLLGVWCLFTDPASVYKENLLHYVPMLVPDRIVGIHRAEFGTPARSDFGRLPNVPSLLRT